MPHFEEEGYIALHRHVGMSVGRSVGPSVGRPKLVRVITQQFLDVWSSNLTWRLGLTSRWPLLILGLIGSKVKVTVTFNGKIILKLVRVITQQCLHPWPSNLTWRLGLTSRWPLLILWVKGQGHSDLESKLDNSWTYGHQTWHEVWACQVDDPLRLWGSSGQGQGHSNL